MQIKFLALLIFTFGALSSCKTVQSPESSSASFDLEADLRFKGLEPFEDKFSDFTNGNVDSAWNNSQVKIDKSTSRVIIDNVEAWYIRWLMIKEAKHSIDISYFIIENDIFGEAFIGALFHKVRNEGISLRIMTDTRGTIGLNLAFFSRDILQELYNAADDYNKDARKRGTPQKAKVEIKAYNPYYKGIINALGTTIQRAASDADVNLESALQQIIASNHDKIMLTDGKYALTGGRNISKNYFLSHTDHPTAYEDADIFIKQPLVTSEMKKAFNREFSRDDVNRVIPADWMGNWFKKDDDLNAVKQAMEFKLMGYSEQEVARRMANSSWKEEFYDRYNQIKDYKELTCYKKNPDHLIFDLIIVGQHCYKTYKPLNLELSSYPTQIWDKTSVLGNHNQITGNLINMINASEREIVIQNPYVILTDEIWGALENACKKPNMRIILHTNSPKSTDSLFTQLWFLNDWEKVLHTIPCMRLFAYEGVKKLHSKVFVFDRKIAAVGSYNLDPLSQNVNSEIMAVINHPTFGFKTAMKIIHADILDPKSKTEEYLIQRDSRGNAILKNGLPQAHPTKRPEKIIEGTKKERTLKLLNLLRRFETLRKIS